MNPQSPEATTSDLISNETVAHEVAAATELSDDMIELSLAELASFDVAELDVIDMEAAAPRSEEPIVLHQAQPEQAQPASPSEIAAGGDSLETVELELALHNQNVVSLGFEESIRTALHHIGGEILFQMRVENDDCQRVAAVRLGQGQEAEFALVILPPGGGLMRVEPVAQSSNPLARITESYAGLMDVFKAAA